MIQPQTEDNALKIYNHLYNNQCYQEVAYRIAGELRLDRESPKVAQVMNTISDVAYMLSGHPRYAEAWLACAIVCASANLGNTGIDAIHDYLLIYQQHHHDVRTGDFAATAKALRTLYQTDEPLQAATVYASEVHTWQARMAYHLLSAAQFLSVAAKLLLKQEDNSYIAEKIRCSIQRLIQASSEGRFSSDPDRFSFSDVEFPKH